MASSAAGCGWPTSPEARRPPGSTARFTGWCAKNHGRPTSARSAKRKAVIAEAAAVKATRQYRPRLGVPVNRRCQHATNRTCANGEFVTMGAARGPGAQEAHAANNTASDRNGRI